MYVGLDIHKRFSYATILDREGNKLFETKFDNKLEEIETFEKMLSKENKIVMEACGSWQYMYDYFDENYGFSLQ